MTTASLRSHPERLPPALPSRARTLVLELLAPQRRRLASTGLAALAVALLSLAGPALLGYAIDHGVREGDLEALNRAALAYASSVAALIPLSRVKILQAAALGESFVCEVRSLAFARVVEFPLGTLEGVPSGSLLARLTSDIEAIAAMARRSLPVLVDSLLLLLVAFVILVVISPPLAAVTLAAVPPAAVGMAWYRRRGGALYAAERERTGDMVAVLKESVDGAAEAQAFGRERDLQRRCEESDGQVVAAYLATAGARNRLRATVKASQVAAMVAIVAGGTLLTTQGVTTVGMVAAFTLYSNRLLAPVEALIGVLAELQSGQAALRRVVGLLDASLGARAGAGVLPLPMSGALELRGVRFGYNGADAALRDVDLRVAPGEQIAIVGATGAGKTTLASLLAGVREPDAGRITFGGVDLARAERASLRERIALVPQEGHMFTGSLADNIRIARPGATDADIRTALEHVGAPEHLREPRTLAAAVSSSGSPLSAGERQLVALARAVLAGPAVIVLDEPTAELDVGARDTVERALRQATGERTLVVVSHSLSTAARADRVAVLDRGRLLGVGTHAELLSVLPIYRELWHAWRLDSGCHL